MDNFEKEKFYKFCPMCASLNVKLTDQAALVAYKELYMRCVDCGFSAKEFPEGNKLFVEELSKSRDKK